VRVYDTYLLTYLQDDMAWTRYRISHDSVHEYGDGDETRYGGLKSRPVMF